MREGQANSHVNDKSYRRRSHIDILLEQTDSGRLDGQTAHVTDDELSSVETRATSEVQREVSDLNHVKSEFDKKNPKPKLTMPSKV